MACPARVGPTWSALAALALVACGPSDAAKGEAAITRLRSNMAPGFFRVVNLAEKPVRATRKDGAPLMGEVNPGEFSLLVALSAKNPSLLLNGRPTSPKIKSGEGTALVVLPGGAVENVPGLVRRPTDAANVWIALAKGDRSVAALKGVAAKGNGARTALAAGGSPLRLSPGDYEVLGEKVRIEPKSAYTFLFVPQKGKLRPFLMLNTPSDKPVGAGASG